MVEGTDAAIIHYLEKTYPLWRLRLNFTKERRMGADVHGRGCFLGSFSFNFLM